MSLAIELERNDNLTVSQWEGFLQQARRAGAADDTLVAEVMATGSDEIIHSYRVEVPEAHSAQPEKVTLPVWLVHDLLSVVRRVATSDGDVRGLPPDAQTTLQNALDHLLQPVLGENADSKLTLDPQE